jgi:diketogulonate reductase-like aldo/keto reductase
MTQAVPNATLAGGVEIPVLGFGTWQITGEQAYQSVRTALEVGYRHIDTATIYQNEREVGRAVADSGVPREDIFITTKLPPRRAGRARETLDASLKALGTDPVDLWLIRWPPGRSGAPELWQEFIKVRDEGLARAVGVSNYSVEQLDRLQQATGEMPAVNQIPWSTREHDPRVLAESRQRGVVLEGYSVLKNSNLRSKVLVELAGKYAVTPVQVLLRWHLEHDIVMIPKSVDPQRIASNFDIFGFSLTPDEVQRIDQSR